MTVAALHVPVEGLELLVDGIGRHDLLQRTVDLDVVVIHKNTEVVQMVVPGSHGCLPDLTLLQLTVAQHGIDPVVLLVYLTGQRHTHSGGNALTETAGGHIYTGHMAHFRRDVRRCCGRWKAFPWGKSPALPERNTMPAYSVPCSIRSGPDPGHPAWRGRSAWCQNTKQKESRTGTWTRPDGRMWPDTPFQARFCGPVRPAEKAARLFLPPYACSSFLGNSLF